VPISGETTGGGGAAGACASADEAMPNIKLDAKSFESLPPMAAPLCR
jgi:hypothetical protein